jgi:hypothetical protein
LGVSPHPASQLSVTSTPTGAAFDIVLILHVACVLIGFASAFTTGIQAWRARAGGGSPGAASVARYFRPGINWPGRALYLVLVLGVVLVAMSQHAYGFADTFVEVGFVLWIIAVGLAEMVVWPGERKIQGLVADDWAGDLVDLRKTSVRVAISAWVVCGVLVVAIISIVQNP